MSQRDLADVRAIMIDFADRTGLLTAGNAPQRYLWTDAFAVCAFLSLFKVTGDEEFLRLATSLIDQVHETLGRHRQDDSQTGWISGLDEEQGRRHPTAGGLRIGKRLNERAEDQPFDERQEWDRDGQYFHYLTKWMHALERAAVVTSNASYCRWAIELAEAAHAAFTYETTDGGVKRMYWKMSIDLSRPLVPSMGHHDPLDAFVTYSELEHCRAVHCADAALPELQTQIRDAAAMCAGQSWVSEDPLGLGGLLIDAYRISQLQTVDATAPGPELEQLLADARAGLSTFVNHYLLHAPADYRLAFREFGLSVGLRAVKALHERIDGKHVSSSETTADELEKLMWFLPMAEQIETFWRQPDNQTASTWRDHRDINSVMLATSLLPQQFLLV
ncbi:MAG: hypothetical protein OER97_04955 [Gammaproteobacteria bacterium]|nr:hypothetical protein [Gammaproteobacteria bacterium]